MPGFIINALVSIGAKFCVCLRVKAKLNATASDSL